MVSTIDGDLITIDGIVTPSSESNIALDPSKGTKYEIKVKEGQPVKKGEPIVVYSNDLISTKISLQEKQIKEKKNQVSKVNSEINSNNQGGAQKVDAQPMTNPNAQAMASAIGQDKGQLKESVSALNTEIEMAEEELKQLKEQRNELTVTSPIDGVIVSVNKENVSATTPLVIIEANTKYIEGQLSEFELTEVTEETPAVVEFKALGDEEYSTEIAKINKRPAENQALAMGGAATGGNDKVSNYKILLELPKIEGKTLENGFHALITLGKKENKIELEKTYLITDDEGNTANKVWVLDNENKLHIKEVEGEEDGEKFYVTKGLTEGDKVVKAPSKDFKEGQEVVSK